MKDKNKLVDSNVICKYCKRIFGKIKTPHGLDTHSTCNNPECQEKLKEWL